VKAYGQEVNRYSLDKDFKAEDRVGKEAKDQNHMDNQILG